MVFNVGCLVFACVDLRGDDVEHGPHLVDLIDVPFLLVNQVEEGPQRQEAVTFHQPSLKPVVNDIKLCPASSSCTAA